MGWYSSYSCLVGIYRTLPALGSLYVCNDEAFGVSNQIKKHKYRATAAPKISPEILTYAKYAAVSGEIVIVALASLFAFFGYIICLATICLNSNCTTHLESRVRA